MRRACVFVFGLAMAWNTLAAGRHYEDKKCFLSFDYPAGWSVAKEAGDECEFTVSPDDMDQRTKDNDVDIWSFSVAVRLESLLDAANEAGFDFVRGKWQLQGFDFRNGPARPFELPGWWGVRGTSDVRAYHPHGGNAGFRKRAAIVAQSGTPLKGDSRVVTISGYDVSSPEMDVVLKTLKLLAAP